MDNIEQGRVQQYSGNEFVVERRYQNLVMEILDNAASVLALIEVSNINQAIANVRAAREGLPASTDQGATLNPTGPLDALLAELRGYFLARYDKWTPQMGKNRLMRGIQLFPYPNAGLPTPHGIGGPEVPVTTAPPENIDEYAGAGVHVGIVDTDLFRNPTLNGRVEADPPGHAFGKTDAVLPWWLGHATFVSGLILQRAPKANVVVHSVLNERDDTASLWSFAKALAGFAETDVAVVNCSMGCVTDDDQPPLALVRAIDALRPNIVVVAAAGNHGRDMSNAPGLTEAERTALPARGQPVWPAALPGVIAVGATDRTDDIADFNPNVPTPSGDGREPVPWLNFWAAGVDVQSTYLDGPVDVPLQPSGGSAAQTTKKTFNGEALWSGTSFAAAALAGAIAANVVKEQRTAAEVVDALRGTAVGPAGSRPPRNTWGIRPAIRNAD
jgi:membrane-anchored mycosin MYCP